MNNTEFLAKFVDLGIQGTGIDCQTKKEITWTDKTTNQVSHRIPAGDHVHLWFSPKKHSNRAFIQHGDFVGMTRLENGNSKFTKIIKAPSLRTLERQDCDGICKTVTGQRVEPDGFGCDGSPSWLLVLGLM